MMDNMECGSLLPLFRSQPAGRVTPQQAAELKAAAGCRSPREAEGRNPEM